MIQDFINRWENGGRDRCKSAFSGAHPSNYAAVLKTLIDSLFPEADYHDPDSSRITTIDDGHHQGTLVFVVAAKTYQPDDYWYTKVNYGSCSGCDTLQRIQEWDDGLPTEQQAADYTTLALHMLQGMKPMQ